MGILGKIFGSEEVIGKAVDGVYNGVDALVYTPEERASRFERLLKLYEPFKLAQRLLALVYCIPYIFLWSVTFLLSFKIDVTVQQAMLNGEIGQIAKLIAGFYFGGGAIESLLRVKK